MVELLPYITRTASIAALLSLYDRVGLTEPLCKHLYVVAKRAISDDGSILRLTFYCGFIISSSNCRV